MEQVSFLTACADAEASVFTRNPQHLPLCVRSYPPEEAERILAEAGEWEILYTWSRGSDYGYSQRDSERGSHTEEIRPEHIIAADGRFAGIVMRSEGSSFNKTAETYSDLTAALIRDYRGEPLLCAYGGTCFDSDDHSSWDTFRYLLQPKGRADA